MKGEVKTPIIVVAVIAVVALIGFFASKAMGAGDLDQGQVKYTPGKPPWQENDPSKRGPGASPGAGAAPAAASDTHAPAGMGAPTLGSGGK